MMGVADGVGESVAVGDVEGDALDESVAVGVAVGVCDDAGDCSGVDWMGAMQEMSLAPPFPPAAPDNAPPPTKLVVPGFTGKAVLT